MAYAEAFLHTDRVDQYSAPEVARLKQLYRHFIRVCNECLTRYGGAISNDRADLQANLLSSYYDLCDSLSELMGERLHPHSSMNGSSYRGSASCTTGSVAALSDTTNA